MPGREPSVTIAGSGEKRQLIDTLTLAFTTSPLVRWFFSDSSTYLQRFPELVEAYGGRSFEQDSAFYAGDIEGGALWLPPGIDPDEEALAELLTETLPEEKHPPAWSLVTQLDAAHPDQPHWVLTHLGVEPTKQGKGYGSALLERGLEMCDAQDSPAYLETSDPRNLPLYLRYGFELREPIQVESAPTVFPMVREPQS